MARQKGTGKMIADALTGKVWDSITDTAADLSTNKNVLYNAISRHHGVYTDCCGKDHILYYWHGSKLTPAEALDINTPLTELLNLSENSYIKSKNVYYKDSKDLADKMRSVEDATHRLVNIMSILYRGEEIED